MNLEEVQARRLARARERQLRARRRRTVALGVVGLLAVVAGAVALASSGTGASPSRVTRVGRRAHVHGRAAGKAAAFHPGSTVTGTATGKPGTTPVPVLMYHVIAPPPAGAPFPGLYVPADQFAAQMSALRAAGWHAVTLDQLEAYWTRGVPLGPG
jgi:hypothetical protein